MFCINVWLTVKDSAEIDEIREKLAEIGRRSREEPGCLRFEVYHSQQDSACFFLCERWESEQAWQTHRQAGAVTEIYQPLVLPRVERQGHPSVLVE